MLQHLRFGSIFDDVLDEVKDRSESGELSQTIANSKIKYQASISHPSLLERIENDGKVTTGIFKNGKFLEVAPND